MRATAAPLLVKVTNMRYGSFGSAEPSVTHCSGSAARLDLDGRLFGVLGRHLGGLFSRLFRRGLLDVLHCGFSASSAAGFLSSLAPDRRLRQRLASAGAAAADATTASRRVAEHDGHRKNQEHDESTLFHDSQSKRNRRCTQVNADRERNTLAIRICVCLRSSTVSMIPQWFVAFAWVTAGVFVGGRRRSKPLNARRGAGRRGNCPVRGCRRSSRSSSRTDTRRGEIAPRRLPARRSRSAGRRRGVARPSPTLIIAFSWPRRYSLLSSSGLKKLKFSVNTPGTWVWPWKAVLRNQREDLFHLPLVVDVFGKDVFVQRVAGRAVDEEHVLLRAVPRQLAEEIPALLPHGGRAGAVFQLVAGPKDGPLGARS